MSRRMQKNRRATRRREVGVAGGCRRWVSLEDVSQRMYSGVVPWKRVSQRGLIAEGVTILEVSLGVS
jgi:hypothetical protein